MNKSDNAFAKINKNNSPLGFIFFTAYIGAVIYFYQQSPDFWGFLLAVFKAIFWPAFVLYNAMLALHV